MNRSHDSIKDTDGVCTGAAGMEDANPTSASPPNSPSNVPANRPEQPLKPLFEYMRLEPQPKMGVDDSEPTAIVNSVGNKVFFTGEVTPGSVWSLTNIVNTKIHGLVTTPDGRIEIWINSPGGSTIAVGTFRDYIKGLRHLDGHRPTIVTVGLDIRSAGMALWLLGDERKLIKGAITLIHSQYSIRDGAIDISQSAKIVDDMSNAKNAKILAKHSGRSAGEWMQVFDTRLDAIISSDAMLELGLATGIIEI
jgi:ATP-dependent protease ClpP protease subunit